MYMMLLKKPNKNNKNQREKKGKLEMMLQM